MKNKHTKIPSFIIPYVTRKTRLDYQLLFREMSPHSSPEEAAGRVRFPLLVSANHVTACKFSSGKDCRINYHIKKELSKWRTMSIR